MKTQKRIHARLPRGAYKLDLREVIGGYKSFPQSVDSFYLPDNSHYELRALKANQYHVIKNRTEIIGQFTNGFIALENFNELRKKLE